LDIYISRCLRQPFSSLLATEKGMGGPRLCLGGRSPTLYQVVEPSLAFVDEADVNSSFSFFSFVSHKV
jgi:hypothetical protein